MKKWKKAVEAMQAMRRDGLMFEGIWCMSQSSSQPAERARKSMTLALSRLQESGRGVAVATAMGISEATVSRIKNERLEEVVTLLAHLGIKCVPAELRCVDPDRMAAFQVLFDAAMSKARPSELVWGDES